MNSRCKAGVKAVLADVTLAMNINACMYIHSLPDCLRNSERQVPGNIRRAEHFVAFLRRFVLYLKEKLGVNQVETENPTTFLAQLQERLNIDGQAFCDTAVHWAGWWWWTFQINCSIFTIDTMKLDTYQLN